MIFNTDKEKASRAASKIRLLALDVDGILTDGRLFFSEHGEELKAFHTLDGHGIKMLQENNIEVAIITGRRSAILEKRAADLNISLLCQGREDKLVALNEIISYKPYQINEVAYAGDDLPDKSALLAAALSFSAPNAHPEIKAGVDVITNLRGGWGAVREMSDFILKSQNKHTPLTN